LVDASGGPQYAILNRHGFSLTGPEPLDMV
jgi:hypothetical protein